MLFSSYFVAKLFATTITVIIGIKFYLDRRKSRQKTTPFSREAIERLQDKVVLVTGASSGLGEELARIFYQHGCRVILASRRVAELQRVKQSLISSSSNSNENSRSKSSIRTFHEPHIAALDLSAEDFTTVESIAQSLINVHNRIDILINNAGISSRAKAIETRVEVDRRMMFVNYLNQVALTKVVLRSMLQIDVEDDTNHHQLARYHIVAISSVQGRIAIPNRSAYSASKHAFQAFFDSLRAEMAADRLPVDVTLVSPGYMRTNLSLNALRADGTAHARMDRTTETGLPPADVAWRIMEAVLRRESEIVLAPLSTRVAILLRTVWPRAYFWIMARYGRQQKG